MTIKASASHNQPSLLLAVMAGKYREIQAQEAFLYMTAAAIKPAPKQVCH